MIWDLIQEKVLKLEKSLISKNFLNQFDSQNKEIRCPIMDAPIFPFFIKPLFPLILPTIAPSPPPQLWPKYDSLEKVDSSLWANNWKHSYNYSIIYQVTQEKCILVVYEQPI